MQIDKQKEKTYFHFLSLSLTNEKFDCFSLYCCIEKGHWFHRQQYSWDYREVGLWWEKAHCNNIVIVVMDNVVHATPTTWQQYPLLFSNVDVLGDCSLRLTSAIPNESACQLCSPEMAPRTDASSFVCVCTVSLATPFWPPNLSRSRVLSAVACSWRREGD